jgi:UDP-N-acetylglucosamine 2-epimerase
MNAVDFMIGNSSSGIIEAPILKKPYIHIGERQLGRERARNVIDVGLDSQEMDEAIQKTLHDRTFRAEVMTCTNPYDKGNASKKIADILSSIDISENILKKRFHD